jgi:mannose-6-phosphate isomerase-like protein (cupin superfamily)
VNDEEEYGGDPPCWAHLFDEEITGLENQIGDRARSSDPALLNTGNEQGADLAALARAATAPGSTWTHQSEDLNVNLLVFAAGEGVAEHVNTEVDVLLVGIVGAGAITVDGTCQILRAEQALLIPKGASRSIRSMSDPFSYISCHCRRGGLWPRG